MVQLNQDPNQAPLSVIKKPVRITAEEFGSKFRDK